MKTSSLGIGLLVLLPFGVLAGNDIIALGAEQAKAIEAAPLAGLATAGERRLPAQALVPTPQMEVVAAPLAGVVTAVKAAYGERVRRGQVLARIQGPQLLELQREYAAARAEAEVAAESRRRDESLFADGIISQSRLSVTRAGDRQAAAALAEKRAALRLAGMPAPAGGDAGFSGSAEVRAAFDGVVLDAPVQPGQRVDATAVLFKLGRLAPLWLDIQATSAQAAGLAVGDAVRVAGCAAGGKLTLIAPHLDATTQALLLRAEMPNADACLKPFQFVQAMIAPARPAAGGVWRVPNGALTRHQGQAWLFVETPGGFRPLAVKVLDETERSTLVGAEPAALDASARIAVRGIAALKAAWLGLGSDGH